jgi:hypothetical protein
MNTSVAVKPAFAPVAADTLLLSIQHIDALASAISNIDSAKHKEPDLLPDYIFDGKQAIIAIWNTVLYPIAPHDIEVATEQIDAFEHCFKCMQDAIATHQVDLLSPFIEAAHDLIELMLGDKVSEVYSPEDAK